MTIKLIDSHSLPPVSYIAPAPVNFLAPKGAPSKGGSWPRRNAEENTQVKRDAGAKKLDLASPRLCKMMSAQNLKREESQGDGSTRRTR